MSHLETGIGKVIFRITEATFLTGTPGQVTKKTHRRKFIEILFEVLIAQFSVKSFETIFFWKMENFNRFTVSWVVSSDTSVCTPKNT